MTQHCRCDCGVVNNLLIIRDYFRSAVSARYDDRKGNNNNTRTKQQQTNKAKRAYPLE